MAAAAKPWNVGDACPACSGELKPVPQPSDAQRAAAANRDNPTPLPPTVDSADPVQIGELGDLHRCTCGYQSRVHAPASADGDESGDPGSDAPQAASARTSKTSRARTSSTGD